ncbi:MAG: sulfite reductase subunit alpha [Opitutales bacterium]|nr:sulfite reductase subunit alpha [Opitutales bacterium]
MPTMPTPQIPETAPFSTEQRAWLNGLMAGLFSGHPGEATVTSVAAAPLTILFGSQSGNSEALAKRVGKLAAKSGFTPTVTDLGDYPPENIQGETDLLIVTSTYGDGEPPDNAKAFYEYLLADTAPHLESLTFAVLGLGDSSYPDFNECAKHIDTRLEALGARRAHKTLLCDVDFEEAAEAWAPVALTALQGEPNGQAPSPISNLKSEIPPALAYDKKNPYAAKVLRNLSLNAAGSAKETRHIEIALGHSGLAYTAGDALGVFPENAPRLVDRILDACGLPEDAPTPLPDGRVGPLAEALRYHYDISRLASPFVEACARLSGHGDLKALVTDKAAMKAYVDGRSLLDPLRAYPVRFPTTEHLVAPLKQLRPRLYSISSSPRAHPGEVHITVGAVRWAAHGEERLGVCSTFLAALQEGSRCRIFFQPNNNFRLPADSATPLIMVGPGTGIAPFRAFIEERAALGQTGKNWLFFGDQKSASDFLYADELKHWQQRGVLTRLDTAFSRDQAEKIYVQDRMREHGRELFDWLEAGAAFCVCGDASRMARDVDAALHEIIARHSGKDAAFATAYVQSLRSAKRYLRDVY